MNAMTHNCLNQKLYLAGFSKTVVETKPEPASKQVNTMQPAFFDSVTGKVFISNYADGRAAPIHIYDGLPQAILNRREMKLISGFVHQGQFLSRQQAMEVMLNRVAS